MITFYDCTFIFDCWKIQFICTCVNQQKWDESALTRKKIVLLLFSHPVNGNGNWWQHIKYNRYWRKPHKQKETNRVLNGSATDEQTNLVPSIVVQLYHRGSHLMAQNSKISPNRKFVHSCMFLLSYIDIFFIRFTACTKKKLFVGQVNAMLIHHKKPWSPINFRHNFVSLSPYFHVAFRHRHTIYFSVSPFNDIVNL